MANPVDHLEHFEGAGTPAPMVDRHVSGAVRGFFAGIALTVAAGVNFGSAQEDEARKDLRPLFTDAVVDVTSAGNKAYLKALGLTLPHEQLVRIETATNDCERGFARCVAEIPAVDNEAVLKCGDYPNRIADCVSMTNLSIKQMTRGIKECRPKAVACANEIEARVSK